MTAPYHVSLIIIEQIEKKNGLEEIKAKSMSFWIYHIMVYLSSNLFFNLNGMFLFYSFYDAYRRVWLMKQLSKSLEGFHTKTG